MSCAMSISTCGHALLVFFAGMDSGLCQRSLHGVPFAGIGSVRPLRSASLSSFSTPMSTVLNGSVSEIEGETATNSTSLNSTADAVDSIATNSSWSSETDVSVPVGANSSSSSSSSSVVYGLELISTNTSAAVGDTVLSNSSGAFTNVSAVEKELVETLEVDEQVTGDFACMWTISRCSGNNLCATTVQGKRRTVAYHVEHPNLVSPVDDEITNRSVLGEVQLGELLCDGLVQAEDAPLLQFALSANEIWNGVVIDPAPDADEAFPRGVSMTWGEVCDIEGQQESTLQQNSFRSPLDAG
ncbi:unnamed protein product [Ectocarpus sp. CCAP 1310/34]|nr:unnamed protein product [Ectocarpus sp. CCAP 1310/34]